MPRRPASIGTGTNRREGGVVGVFTRISGLLLAVLLLVPLAASAADALIMGVFPRRNATLTDQLYTPLAAYLSRELGREVKLVTAKDFSTFWQGVESRRYDIVHYNQYHYVISSDAYQAIAHNEEFGRDSLAGVLIVRKDSGISDVAQLRGKTVIFGGGPDAMMSAIVPRYLLQQAGLHEGDYHAEYATNPPNALLAVYFHQADAAGDGDVVPELPVVRRRIDPDAISILARSRPITHLPWAVRRDLPASLRQRIQSLMVGLVNSDEGQAILKTARLTALRPARDGDYATAREIIRQVMPDETP